MTIICNLNVLEKPEFKPYFDALREQSKCRVIYPKLLGPGGSFLVCTRYRPMFSPDARITCVRYNIQTLQANHPEFFIRCVNTDVKDYLEGQSISDSVHPRNPRCLYVKFIFGLRTVIRYERWDETETKKLQGDLNTSLHALRDKLGATP